MTKITGRTERAAYWQHRFTGTHIDVAGINCTRYADLGEPRRIVGFALTAQLPNGQPLLAKHLRVAISADNGTTWRTIYEGRNLPRRRKLIQRFHRPVTSQFVKLEMLEHHRRPSIHTEIAANTRCVVFDALNNVQWLVNGSAPRRVAKPVEAAYHPPLVGRVAGTRPRANEIHFTRPSFRVGFSLVRPMLTFLGFDSLGTKRFQTNLLSAYNLRQDEPSNGPWLLSLAGRVPANLCGGEVEVRGRQVRYRNVSPVPGLRRDYTFTVERDALRLTIDQRVSRRICAIECEAWRWIWNARTAVTATLARPWSHGKTGRCVFPAIWHAPNFGSLAVELLDGDPTRTFLKADTWRAKSLTWSGIECGTTLAADGAVVLERGRTITTVCLRPARLELAPTTATRASRHPTFRRAWGSVFGFRPEYFGMSNNAASLNCHFVQSIPMDMAAQTVADPAAARPLELCAHGVELALAGGIGYGDNRDYFLDADPALVIAAGTYLSRTRDRDWAAANWPKLQACARRMLDKQVAGGLLACRTISGNAGMHQWSSNWWDVICFGHQDAYANGYAYRAFRQLASVARFLGEDRAEQCYRVAADGIRRDYFDCFFNKQTGWLGGWRSRDGKLHDYGFLFINGMAIVLGLVPENQRRPILDRLERKRRQVGYRYFHLGLPGNLLPIRREDYARDGFGAPQRADGRDSFGYYENGAASMCQAYWYVRALGMLRLPVAREIGKAILDALERGDIIGGLHGGNDWRTWDGRANGYEGVAADQFNVLLAIAQNQGLADDLSVSW